MRRLPGLLVAVALALSSCGDNTAGRPQWIVHVGTDAPLPGFGDRLRIDVLDEDGIVCPTCSRVFDTSADEAFPLSFGVEPLADGGRRFVRARLHRAENTDETGEPSEPLIDLLAELPTLSDELLEVQATLATSCFGKPADIASFASCDPKTGEIASFVLERGDTSSLPRTGSFAGGDIECVGETPEGMVCVPGGVFLMGSRSFIPFGPDFDPVPEQLVQLSPFFLDVAEMDVKTARAQVAKGEPAPPVASASYPRCSYTAEPGENELATVNCVDRKEAAQLCAAQGKRLPTEAEWEFAAVARTADAPYPWSAAGETDTAAICRTAIVARGDFDVLDSSRQCILEIDAEPGPVAGGSPLDVTDLQLRDLGGNMSEWVQDDFASYADETCWGSEVSLRRDPLCKADPTLGIVRGGSWQTIPYNTHGFFRRSAVSAAYAENVGVRCAKDIE